MHEGKTFLGRVAYLPPHRPSNEIATAFSSLAKQKSYVLHKNLMSMDKVCRSLRSSRFIFGFILGEGPKNKATASQARSVADIEQKF